TRIRLQIEMMDMLAGALPSDTKAKFDKRAHAITRDLSGLNDLVESILLVSRLDAGHALQQIENLDLYDLVNQERQHYPEATLIGEHIMIDGQSSMLTHLIRNLLTNAMLHGKPPVTVLLYGVQTIEDAGTVPDYLLQTVLSSSFTDYNSLLDFDSYEGSLDTNSDEQESASLENADSTLSNKDKIDSVEPIAVLPAPPIYKNGENLTVDEDVNADLNFIKNTPSSVKPNAHIASTDLDKVIWKAVPDPKDTLDSNKGVHDNLIESTDGTIDNRAHALENDSNRKTDKVATDTTIHKNGSKDKAKNSAKANTPNNNEAAATPRKEGLFAKHLKKAKAEPVRPLPKYAVLAVIDEGTGIPEEKREEVFSPFVRLQQKNKGSGLGLSLVSQIVTAHQGRITTDTLNGHTRFLVAIPVEHDPHYNQHD
ncbi:MAG: ATP-binding protein, partial [Pseudomonadota bacterium]|nr:ATP-binding protein [Pseudomonadota bacterium]